MSVADFHIPSVTRYDLAPHEMAHGCGRVAQYRLFGLTNQRRLHPVFLCGDVGLLVSDQTEPSLLRSGIPVIMSALSVEHGGPADGCISREDRAVTSTLLQSADAAEKKVLRCFAHYVWKHSVPGRVSAGIPNDAGLIKFDFDALAVALDPALTAIMQNLWMPEQDLKRLVDALPGPKLAVAIHLFDVTQKHYAELREICIETRPNDYRHLEDWIDRQLPKEVIVNG